jgi:hypothetical protein
VKRFISIYARQNCRRVERDTRWRDRRRFALTHARRAGQVHFSWNTLIGATLAVER